MFKYIELKIGDLYSYLGVNGDYIDLLSSITEIILALIVSYLIYKIADKFIIKFLTTLAMKTKSKWDDILLERKVFSRIAYLVPAYFLYIIVPMTLTKYPDFIEIFRLAIHVYTIIILMLILLAFFNSILHIYSQFEISKIRPIKGYIQVAKIIIYVLSAISLISVFIGKSPMILLGGLGAFSAILLLVFKDSILGLVAGVQLTSNDMLRTGDWISMPKYGADGTVIDISLTTVKVQNWDKTISSIPAYSLFSDSFKNWRGMEDSGGRRIKRSVNIDMNSIKFCTSEMLKKFERFQYVSEYVKNTEKKVEEFNINNNIDPTYLVNGRRQTNIGVFRAYLRGYLHNHPKISDSMTFLIRQLQPGDTGLPMEIYVFSKVQEWAAYEDIQSDIFDHIFAVIPEFELRVFQNPTGADFKSVFKS